MCLAYGGQPQHTSTAAADARNSSREVGGKTGDSAGAAAAQPGGRAAAHVRGERCGFARPHTQAAPLS